MTHQNPSDEEIFKILSEAKTIAIVGASVNPQKTSNAIIKRLQEWGYKTIPVNPNEKEILGEQSYASLADIPVAVDIVDVFRRPEHTSEIAAAAAGIGARVLWLQQGIVSEEAAAIAKKGGLTVVMDSCIAVMHQLLKVAPKK